MSVVGHPGGRSAMTCHYRCGNACAQEAPNAEGGQHFGLVAAQAVSRRGFLRLGGTTAVVGLLAASGSRVPVAAAAEETDRGLVDALSGGAVFDFRGIAPVPATTDMVVVPPGFTWAPLIRWGDPILRGAPAFDFDRQSVRAQERQFGYNNDFTALIRESDLRGLLVCNHEYTNDELMFRRIKSSKDLSVEQIRVVMAAHGMSVVEVARKNVRSPWRYLPTGRRNRRITASTPFAVTGPASGSALLRTSADPQGRRILGTLNNCSGGVTPWGTVLSGEENFNQYFKADAVPPARRAMLKRYGIDSGGRGWERADRRFDLVQEPQEANRFGWVVEVDPYDPTAVPRKHTALGRLKHEAATVAVDDDGTVACYTGDDERFEYLYKFVSHFPYREGDSAEVKAHNARILTSGDLFVAAFTAAEDVDMPHAGVGTWLPLVKDGRSAVPGMSLDEVLVFTRAAADKVGATKMDRPEDVETNPVNGKVYMVCTNNTKRRPGQVDPANPRPANKHGHIIEITPDSSRHASDGFTWDLVLVAGDPSDPDTYFAGMSPSDVTPISCPDNITFDSAGHLWIATDGQPGTLNHCDGLYMMTVDGPERGKLRRFLTVPVGAETCGPVVSWDDRTVIVAVQHPGEVDGASPDRPASTFPYDGPRQPRPSVIQVHRT
ncbi:PhoX family protein [Austwickia chelonae]|uniref:PhoX family protein n=1 Tax=Austwickia chelonae TaxID=100225 RepID=UPI001F072BBC|nr:PhoX family phosphatase [Austwickia chelonae]